VINNNNDVICFSLTYRCFIHDKWRKACCISRKLAFGLDLYIGFIYYIYIYIYIFRFIYLSFVRFKRFRVYLNRVTFIPIDTSDTNKSILSFFLHAILFYSLHEFVKNRTQTRTSACCVFIIFPMLFFPFVESNANIFFLRLRNLCTLARTVP